MWMILAGFGEYVSYLLAMYLLDIALGRFYLWSVNYLLWLRAR